MKRISNRLLMLSLVLLLAIGCKEQAFDEHYARPSWLKGNAWELLDSKGNYTIFLDAIAKSGNQGLVQGKGIVTVMAPNDDAFNAYFQKKGISGVDQMTVAELRKLVGFHMVYYSYNKDQFSNFKPYGTASERLNEEGLYYKHRTYSRDTLSFRQDPSDQNRVKAIFHKERFLPVMSSKLFTTKGIDAKYNYEFFYPQSTWSGDNGGFNVSNAEVEEYSIPTDNGYVYLINEVLDPLETIYNDLADNGDYSTFLNTYDRFIDFWYDSETSNEYAAIGDSLFIIKHTGLPEIASEWSYNGELGIPDYANFPDLTGKAYNVFAPSNQAFDDFFNSYWKGYYNSLDEVGFLPISYLLYNHVNQGSIVFPEEITQNLITTPFGNPIVFDPEADVLSRKICVNGSYYGLGSVIVPPMFTSVTGPAFQDPKYRMFLFMLAKTGIIGPLMSDALNYTIFMPSDDVVSDVLFDDSYIYWSEGNPLKLGDEDLLVDSDGGGKVSMSTSSMRKFVNNYIVNEAITDLSKKAVYRTRNTLSYIFVAGDSVTTNQAYNKRLQTVNEKIDGPENGNWTNGVAYTTDRAMLDEGATVKSLISGAQTIGSELSHISEFAKLLGDAGLIPADAELGFLLGNEFMLFAPSNDLIIAAKANGDIPTDPTELATYLKYYFVPLPLNGLNDFAFGDFGVDGDFKTTQLVGTEYSVLKVVDNGGTLSLEDATGGTATVTSVFPQVYRDGAVYSIDNILKAQ